MALVAVDAEMVRPLRREVLRPTADAAELRYPHDGDADALHAAVIEDGEVVGAASVTREPHPREPRRGDWRLRGMATRRDRRRNGIGAALLEFCEGHARHHGGSRLWCNARVGARTFYERHGFAADGETFDIAGIGPHELMSKGLG